MQLIKLSFFMAEDRGFEPRRPFTSLLAFQASPFSLLGNSPLEDKVGFAPTNKRVAVAAVNYFGTYPLSFPINRVAKFF